MNLTKDLPYLPMYLETRHVGGSRRRGRNAVNAWAADTLVAVPRRRAELEAAAAKEQAAKEQREQPKSRKRRAS